MEATDAKCNDNQLCRAARVRARRPPRSQVGARGRHLGVLGGSEPRGRGARRGAMGAAPSWAAPAPLPAGWRGDAGELRAEFGGERPRFKRLGSPPRCWGGAFLPAWLREGSAVPRNPAPCRARVGTAALCCGRGRVLSPLGPGFELGVEQCEPRASSLRGRCFSPRGGPAAAGLGHAAGLGPHHV